MEALTLVFYCLFGYIIASWVFEYVKDALNRRGEVKYTINTQIADTKTKGLLQLCQLGCYREAYELLDMYEDERYNHVKNLIEYTFSEFEDYTSHLKKEKSLKNAYLEGHLEMHVYHTSHDFIKKMKDIFRESFHEYQKLTITELIAMFSPQGKLEYEQEQLQGIEYHLYEPMIFWQINEKKTNKGGTIDLDKL